MHWAAIGGHKAAGETLAEAGANIFAITKSKMSVLHASSEAGRAGFAEFLIKRAGERKNELFDARDGDGKLAIELATLVRREQAKLLWPSYQNNNMISYCYYD